MVAIKDTEMPTDCKKCFLIGTDGNPKDLLSPMMCIAIWAITHEIKHCVGGQIRDDCPLVEIEERKVEKLEKIEKIVNCELIAGKRNYKSCYNAFYEIVDVIQERE